MYDKLHQEVVLWLIIISICGVEFFYSLSLCEIRYYGLKGMHD